MLADGDLALAPPVDAPTPTWLRHEGLAEPLDVLFADLPAPTPEIEAQWLASQPGLGAALRVQLLTLKRQLGLASPEEAAAVAAHKAAASDRLRPTRDPDGFRKQLLVLTRGGRLAALHNGDGRLLWSADFSGAAGAGDLPRKLALWRVPHRAGQDLEVVALSPARAWVVNAHTGTVGVPLALPGGPAAELLQLPTPAREGGADQHAFVAVPAAGGASALLPDSPAAHAAFEAARPGLTFWRLDAEGGALTGHGFGPDGLVQERWRVVAAPPGGPYRVLAAAGQAAGEAVYSFARVTGTGDLMFKARRGGRQ